MSLLSCGKCSRLPSLCHFVVYAVHKTRPTLSSAINNLTSLQQYRQNSIEPSVECDKLLNSDGRVQKMLDDTFQFSRPLVITRDSIYAIARLCYGNSVCPSVRLSVRLSHGWISQKRLKLGSRNFHHTVAPSL